MENKFLNEKKDKIFVSDSVLMPMNIKQCVNMFGMHKVKDTYKSHEGNNKK